MKKFWLENKNIFILFFLIVASWQLFLASPYIVGKTLVRQHPGYIGSNDWANLDGQHYLSIAQRGYVQFEQAFFPLFPLLIWFLSMILRIIPLYAGFIVVYVSLFLALLFFYRLILLDYDKKIAVWSVLFLLAFPTSFFLGAIYTEGLFLTLLLASFYFARKRNLFLAGILGGLASLTRLVGVLLFPSLLLELYIHNRKEKVRKRVSLASALSLLLIPLGTIVYMIYLLIAYHDPLYFIHAQPAFGAGRSGGGIILLPQVLWRYIKIFRTIPLSNHDFWVAFLEFIVFFVVLFLLYRSFKVGIRKSYILFGLLSILLPTLSGTLSSIPRYALTSFVIFIYLAMEKNTILRYSILLFFLVLQGILAALFLRGYFVS